MNRRYKLHSPIQKRRGFSILEILIVLALVGILATISATSIRSFKNPAQDSALQLERLLKQVRLKAMSTTSARVVTREVDGNNNVLAVYSMDYCHKGNVWKITQENKLLYSEDNPFGLDTSFPKSILTFDDSVNLITTNKWWWLCFDSQGRTESFQINNTSTFMFKDHKENQAGVKYFVGGDIRITDAEGNIKE